MGSEGFFFRAIVNGYLTSKKRRRTMTKIFGALKKFGKNEEGAALIEYTVLLGILLVAVIVSITFVGGWINTQWTNLVAAL
jgi:pilus assembly protein Flp/PilA